MAVVRRGWRHFIALLSSSTAAVLPHSQLVHLIGMDCFRTLLCDPCASTSSAAVVLGDLCAPQQDATALRKSACSSAAGV